MKKISLRIYGTKPFKVALLHGGPGAPGYMAPFARTLSKSCGVLEPLQTKKSIKGQIRELKKTIKKHGNPPFTLIGSSWGALLGYIFSAQHPNLVNKLILVGSAVFEDKYADYIMERRLKRLNETEKKEIKSIMDKINDPDLKQKSLLLRRMGDIFHKSDCYNPIVDRLEILEYQPEIYQKIWKQAVLLRKQNKLLKMGSKIKCSVVAIHGEYDPHPFEGVRDPLTSILCDFRFLLLKQCGHIPWIEKGAKDTFFKIIKNELSELFTEEI